MNPSWRSIHTFVRLTLISSHFDDLMFSKHGLGARNDERRPYTDDTTLKLAVSSWTTRLLYVISLDKMPSQVMTVKLLIRRGPPRRRANLVSERRRTILLFL